jgi:hypothetical protein
MHISENSLNRHTTIRDDSEKWTHDPNDWYVEPKWSVDLLLDEMKYEGTILDPACGMGTIVNACLSRGLDAYGSDKVDRGYDTPVIDFLADPMSQGQFDHIITNPPYFSGKGSVAFMDKALMVARKSVSILVPIPFLSSQGRWSWFRGLPISHVFILSKRPSMPPGSLLASGAVQAKGGKEDYVWIVASHGHGYLPVIDWLLPEYR